jgi:hypothetical protein
MPETIALVLVFATTGAEAGRNVATAVPEKTPLVAVPRLHSVWSDPGDGAVVRNGAGVRKLVADVM